jgi:Domain of unknown function (DUF4249)
MKNRQIYPFVMFLTSVLFGISCNNELVTIEGAKDIPVVYAILSTKDTATYIRVEKAFSDPTRNAFEVAQIADSLYYNDAKVTLVRNQTNERFDLTQVDGNTEGYPRKDGIFAKAPNKMYKIKTSLLKMKANEDWRIEVVRQGKTIAKELTKVVGDYVLTAPVNKTLFFRADNQFSVSVETDENEQTGRIYEANIILNIDETLNGTTQSKKLVWAFDLNDNRGRLNAQLLDPAINFQRRAKEFYDFLGNNVPVVLGISRTIKSIDIEVLIGGQEFIDYRKRFNSNSGITGSQTISNYTNVGGSLGFVGSRNRVFVTDFKLSNETLDALKNTDVTKNLGFK